MYHIICRGNNKSIIFRRPGDYGHYLSLLKNAKHLYGFDLYHFVLMPNHVHLLLKPHADNMSELMHVIQMGYAKYFCGTYRHIGHVWQDRFKSIHIENDPYLFACGSYIEMNPVRAGLVAHPEDWGWSSFQHYATKPMTIVDTDPLFESFRGSEEEKRVAYRKALFLARAA